MTRFRARTNGDLFRRHLHDAEDITVRVGHIETSGAVVAGAHLAELPDGKLFCNTELVGILDSSCSGWEQFKNDLTTDYTDHTDKKKPSSSVFSV